MLLGIIKLRLMNMCCATKQFSATKISNRKIKIYLWSDGFVYKKSPRWIFFAGARDVVWYHCISKIKKVLNFSILLFLINITSHYKHILQMVLHHIFLVLMQGSWGVHVCCLHLKMKFRSCARGRQWCGIIHHYWWTASIKPRLLFFRESYASWGLSLSSV